MQVTTPYNFALSRFLAKLPSLNGTFAEPTFPLLAGIPHPLNYSELTEVRIRERCLRSSWQAFPSNQRLLSTHRSSEGKLVVEGIDAEVSEQRTRALKVGRSCPIVVSVRRCGNSE